MAEPEGMTMEAFLARAAEAVPVPAADEFAAVVVTRVRAGAGVRADVPRRARRWGDRRRGAVVAGAVLAAGTAMVTLVAPVRSAVADLLGVDGVHITRANPVPVPVPTTAARPVAPTVAPTTTTPSDPVAALHLGARTTLRAAAGVVGFDMRLPTIGGYDLPDAVLIGTPPAGGMVSMVYLPKPGRPAVANGGISALLSEFRGHIDPGFFQKLVGTGTNVEPVQVAGAAGFWLSGAPHEFFYVGPGGQVDTETIRLAANTLLWSAGGITYRFESALPRATAVVIADSMRNVGTNS